MGSKKGRKISTREKKHKSYSTKNKYSRVVGNNPLCSRRGLSRPEAEKGTMLDNYMTPTISYY